ncbi:MAG: hypothetical protein HYR80_03565 [Nitrospirae bacterium]|nr:hypothetical protein [Nitrospirota bacterium]
MIGNCGQRLLVAIAFILFLNSIADAGVIPERRKSQFSTEFGYAVFPYPYSLPGIGSGVGLVGGASNVAGTHTDAYGILFGGQIIGLAVGLADVQILPKMLILDSGFSKISSANIQNYSQRGMNTDQSDYTNIELGDITYYGSRLTATFFDRRFEFYGAYYEGSTQLKSIRDRDGNIIVQSQNAPVERGHVALVGTRLDLTDDYADPRRGFRLDISRTMTPPREMGPDFYLQDYNASAYFPLGRRSTWAFSFLRSDAHVDQKGETNPSTIESTLGLNCSALAPPQAADCTHFIQNTVVGNTYGTATTLGGFNRLRSYPNMRYQGSHTLFYGSEIRWNLTDESTFFDIFIMRDIRNSWQLAFFYETGSTADEPSQPGDVWRSSAGFGLRMVTASGVVFRADLATGSEGTLPCVFIGYPWEL